MSDAVEQMTRDEERAISLADDLHRSAIRDQIEKERKQQTLVDAAHHSLTAAVTAIDHLAAEFQLFESHLSEQQQIAVFVICASDEHAFFPDNLTCNDV